MVEKVSPKGPHNHGAPNRASEVQARAAATTPTIGAGKKLKKSAADTLYPPIKKA